MVSHPTRLRHLLHPPHLLIADLEGAPGRDLPVTNRLRVRKGKTVARKRQRLSDIARTSTKGERVSNVSVIRPADLDFKQLMSYRYYRMLIPPGYK